MQAKRTAFNTGTSTLSSRAQQQLTELEAKKLSSDRRMVTLTGHSVYRYKQDSLCDFYMFWFCLTLFRWLSCSDVFSLRREWVSYPHQQVDVSNALCILHYSYNWSYIQ